MAGDPSWLQRFGAATSDELTHLNNIAANMNRAAVMAPANIVNAIGQGAYDFGRGFLNGAPAAAATSAAAPSARISQPVEPPLAVNPLTGDRVAAYGQLSPSARAVLNNQDPAAVQAADKINQQKTAAALQGIPTFAQLMAGYAAANGGKISLRAIDALAGAAQKGAAAGSAARKPPSITDVAGAQALQLGSELFAHQKADAVKSGDKVAYLKAIQEHQDRLERLARARAIDPISQAEFANGVP